MTKNPIQLYYMSFVVLRQSFDKPLDFYTEGFSDAMVYFFYLLVMLTFCWLVSFPIFSKPLYYLTGIGVTIVVFLIFHYLFLWIGDTQKRLREEASRLTPKMQSWLVRCNILYFVLLWPLLVLFAKLCHTIE